MGWHHYECTNGASEHDGQSRSRGDSCPQFKSDEFPREERINKRL